MRFRVGRNKYIHTKIQSVLKIGFGPHLASRPSNKPGPRFPEKGRDTAMLNVANAIRVPGKINTFPQGESSDSVSVPVSVLREILSELQDLKAYRSEIQELREKIDRLEANQKQQENQSSDSNQEEEPIQKASVTEPKKDQNAKIIFLDTNKREDPHEIIVLKAEIAKLEAAHEKDLERLALEMALDRQRIAKLEKKEPQPLQKDRGKILRALIVSSGGKILAKQARQIMHLDKATFSRLLGTLSDSVARKIYSLDRRQRLLVLG